EGVRVLLGIPDMKVHAKLCVIRKKEFNHIRQYAFFSTGNFNENTAQYYGDHCLLTTHKKIIADINQVFHVLESAHPNFKKLKSCKTLILAHPQMRRYFLTQINKEINTAQKKLPASILIKLNSLADQVLITKLYLAAQAGVSVEMIIRRICCACTELNGFKGNMKTSSTIDEYLEHARVFVFECRGQSRSHVSSPASMVRNLTHRMRAACTIIG